MNEYLKPISPSEFQENETQSKVIAQRPAHIKENHWREWVEDSKVDPLLTALNVRSLSGTTPHEYLLYGLPDSERRNDGRLRDKWLYTYQHLEDGGWWCSGFNILKKEESSWGCFKPNHPRRNKKDKPIKYEHPPQIPTEIFALHVPDLIWDKIAKRYGIERDHSSYALELQEQSAPITFWEWILEHPEIPVMLTEGAKKAGASLTAGYVAIALPGIFNGYRQPKDEFGNVIALPHLIPQLELLAKGGRTFYFAFDSDSKPKTIANVRTAITTTAKLILRLDCSVKVIQWQQPVKGVDDLIAAYSVDALCSAYNEAKSLDDWLAEQITQLTYPVALKLNQRYLGDFCPPPTARLIALKSPKGTGKTEWLAIQVQEAVKKGQPVLIITHRVQLGQALSERFGVPYVTEIKDSQFGKTLGYGLCVDSLHPYSMAQFKAESWHDALIIIDECEQVFWHLLNADTEVRNHRVSILRSLKTLIQTALGGEGKIYLSDADLSDVSVDYVKSLAGFSIIPWVVVNEYQNSETSWDVFTYGGHNPRFLVASLVEDLKTGGKPFICCSAQKVKSPWGTRNLEAYLRKLFPHLKILRIDSESIANPKHPAYGCISRLNEILTQYDIVLASPSLETGVSIDIKGHFTGVWIIAQGSTPENSVRQFGSRIRDNIPRHIWAAQRGLGQIGNGSTSIKSLIASQHVATRLNIRLLAESQFDGEIEANLQPESLNTWAKFASRINYTMMHYRTTILAGLLGEGHRLIEVSESEAKDVEAEVKATKEEKYKELVDTVSAAENPDDTKYEELSEKRSKTDEELIIERKGRLCRRYGGEVTPELVVKDDQGWYSQLLLHYYFTAGRKFLLARDFKRAKSQVEQGQGAIFQPDFNRSLLLASVRMLEVFRIDRLFNSSEQFSSTDEFLVRMAEMVKQNRSSVKCILNLTINEKDTPIAICQALLGKLGLKLPYLGRLGSRDHRARVYGGVAINDGREEIFRRWLKRDEVNLAAA